MQNEAPRAISPASWLAAGLISLIVSSAVIVDGISGLIAPFDPALSLSINPLRSDERIAVAVKNIDQDGSRDLVETGLSLSPIDGRFYSLMGILAERDGDKQTASRFYLHALDLLPTEIQALTRQLSIDLDESRYSDAAEKLGLLGRRWPGYWPAVEPVLPALLSTEESYGRIMRDFGGYPPLRNLLVRSLAATADTLPFAYRLVLDWHEGAAADLGSIINQVTFAFLRERQYVEAYLFFQLTRPDAARSGYVYNNSFDAPFSGNPFDWMVRDQAGVSFKQLLRTGDSSLSVRFLDNPIQFRNISQLIRLVPGPYSVTVSYDGRDLVTPKPIQLGVRCIPSNAVLASAPLSEGSSSHDDAVDFVVPTAGCVLQEIFFYNDKMPMSWQNRYQGTLLVKSVTIMRRSGV